MSCNKKQFASHREAKEVMNLIYKSGARNKAPTRIYWCEICESYHFTSKGKEGIKCKRKSKGKRAFSHGYLESWQKRKRF